MTPALGVSLYVASIIALFLSRLPKESSIKFLLKTIAFTLLGVLVIMLYAIRLIDDISLILGSFLTITSLLISLYTVKYMELNQYPHLLEVFMDFFLLLIVSTYIAPSFILLIISWTISEILGYLLIKMGEEHSIEGSLTSSRGFIFTSTLTFELSVFTMLSVSALFTAANIGLVELIKPFTEKTIMVSIPVFFLPLLIVGFLVKTANIPLHFWLPSAHSSAPSPASATLSGLMVSLGYYGLYRVLEYIEIEAYKQYLSIFLVIIGLLSILYGGLQANTQRDSKRLLAYSTIATDGFVSILFALYLLNPALVTKYTLILGILMHAAYKTTLFSEAGLIETIYGTRYIHGIRGLSDTAPISSIGGFTSVFSLIGVPGTIGFAAKLLSVYCALLILESYQYISVISLIGIAVYIIVSALIGLRYSQVYYREHTKFIEPIIGTIDKAIQTPILLMGLMNIAWPIIISLIVVTEYTFLVLMFTPISVLSVLVFYMYTRSRRGVAKQ